MHRGRAHLRCKRLIGGEFAEPSHRLGGAHGEEALVLADIGALGMNDIVAQ
jgi:hypothetical protein